MFTIFQEEKLITAGILAFFAISILLRITLGFLYLGMIKETDNMAATNNRLLKQCKLKFSNCYQMNNGMSNISVFVDKFLNRLSIGPFSFVTVDHLSGQSMLLSVIFSGVGICKGIADGRTLGGILPFYIVSFFGLYLYFTVSTIVDVKGKRRVLKINLIDYLENHLSSRIGVTESDMEMLYGEDRGRAGRGSARRRTVELMPVGGRAVPEAERASRDPLNLGRPILSESEIAAASERMQPFNITDEELEELLKEFLPT